MRMLQWNLLCRGMVALGAPLGLPLGLLPLAETISCGPARADGPPPNVLSGALAAGASSFPTIPFTVNVPNGVAGLNAAGQITAPVIGDTTAAQQRTGLPNATNTMTTAVRNALSPNVSDYLPNGSIPGTGVTLDVLASQAAGDRSVTVLSTLGLSPGRLVTSPLLPTGTTIASVGVGLPGLTATCTTLGPTLTAAHEAALAPAMTGPSNALACAGVIGVPAGANVVDAKGNTIGTVHLVTYPTTPSGNATTQTNTTLWLSQDVRADIGSGANLTATFTGVVLKLSAGWSRAITPADGPVGIATQDDSQAFINVSFYSREDLGGHRGLFDIPAGGYYRSSTVYAAPGTGYEWTSGTHLLPGSAGDDTTAGTGYFNARFAKSISFKDDTSGGGVLALYDTLTEPEQTVTQGEALLIKQVNNTRFNDGGIWGPGMVGAEVQQSLSPGIGNGIMWAYHSTDMLMPGQLGSWAGAELELYNTSGFWGAFGGNPLSGNKTGLHIDDIGQGPATVANSIAFEADGPWHTVTSCGGNVLDWCVVKTNANYSDFMSMPIAGIDSQGRILASAFAVSMPAQPGGVTQNG